MKKCIGTYGDQELDAEIGLYNYNARLYDPAIGIFISPDSIVQDPYDPQTLNRYAYCRNNPLIYTDPSGHFFGIDNLIGAAVGAVIGGVTSAITGGDIWEGMLTGAVSGALFAFTPGINEAFNITTEIGKAGVHAGIGAASGGINSAITGSDVGLGMITGGISGGIGKYFGEFIPDNFGAQLAGRSIIGGVTGGISAEIYGADFADGFVYGAKTAAIATIANDMIHGENPFAEQIARAKRFAMRLNLALASIFFRSPIGIRAPEYLGGRISESGFLRAAEKYLGKGYRSLPNGRYVSKNGLRQIRYGAHETGRTPHHAHFEVYNKPFWQGGKVIENTLVIIAPEVK